MRQLRESSRIFPWLGAWLGAAIACAAGAGCLGDIVGDDGAADAPSSDPGSVTLAFRAPIAGSDHVRDAVADTGALAAAIDVALAVSGAPARLELRAGDRAIEIDASRRATAYLADDGDATLTATAYDAAGAPIATASVAVHVRAPDVADCHGWLDLYRIDYRVGPSADGVADPVTLTPPINGVAYRYLTNTAPRATFFMDCSLARTLAAAAPLLRARGITEVADLGVYNYRCIAGRGTPPDCEVGLSQHAFATALDIAGVTDAAGVYYSVNDDWVIDPPAEPTCAAATEPGKDRFLHELVCSLKAAGLWHIMLTPNYNAEHRNHVHVDLTPGADSVRSRGAVDVGADNH